MEKRLALAVIGPAKDDIGFSWGESRPHYLWESAIELHEALADYYPDRRTPNIFNGEWDIREVE